MSLVEIHSVRKVFSSNGTAFEAIKGVNLDIEQGELISVTGESGSGKSTLLSLIGGITPPTTGDIVVDTIPICELSSEKLADYRREYIGFVFQQFHLIPYLTAMENVMLPLSISRQRGKEKQALNALTRVGMELKASRLPSQLSGGEQQRVAIARALVNEPPIILADEPTGNLDTKNGNEIFKLFKELNCAGQTIIIVTHNLELASRTRRIVNMKDGLIMSVTNN